MKKNTALLILLLINLISFGQSKLEISYNETINIKNVEESTTFTISSDYGNLILKGNEISTYKFKKPGIYLIKVDQKKEIHNEETCGHTILPSQITVNVSRIKMKFEGSKIEFSSPIKKNTETSGIVLSIPVAIETYDNKPIMMDLTLVNSSGIGSLITAALNDNFKQLPTGKHLISYNLNGAVSQNSYLMFDFIDANGRVQSISLQSPIEN
jgi:hypothetical protein